MTTQRERGNVLFILLISIALLGLLTVLLTRSSSTSEDTGSDERNAVLATALARYAGEMSEAYANLVSRGCSEYQINFNQADVTGYANAKAPADKSCNLFSSGGAGLANLRADKRWLDSSQSAASGYGYWSASNDVCVEGAGPRDAAACISNGVNDEETVLWLGYVKKNLCMALNRVAGVANDAADAPVSASSPWDPATRFVGNVAEGKRLDTSSARFSRKKAGCFKQGTSYVFFQILAAH